MDPGALDRRIVIQKRITSQSDSGEDLDGWLDQTTVWAKRRDIRAGERFGAASQRIDDIDTIFTVRFNATLRFMPDLYRVVFEGRLYDVLGITELVRRAYLEIACRARAEDSLSQN